MTVRLARAGLVLFLFSGPACQFAPPAQRCVEGRCAEGSRCDVETQLCLRRGKTVFEQPRAGAVVGRQVQAVVALEDVPHDLEPTLQLEVQQLSGEAVAQTTLSRQPGGTYAGTWTAPAEGAYRLLATGERTAAQGEPVEVTVDLSAPVFLVSFDPAAAEGDGGQLLPGDPDPAYAAAHRRDERITLTVTSGAGDVDLASVAVKVQGQSEDGGTLGELSLQVVPKQGCATPWCGTAELELWRVPLHRAHGELSLWATGKDVVGNDGASGPFPLPVTRWKWTRALSSEGSQLAAPPVLGREGRLFAATSELDGGATLRAVEPEGEERWSVPLAGTSGGLVVGEVDDGLERLYLFENAPGRLMGVDTRDGVKGELCAGLGGRAVSLAVTQSQLPGEARPLETAVALLDASGGTLVAARPGADPSCLTLTNVGAPPGRGGLVVRENRAYFGHAEGATHFLAGYDLRPEGWVRPPGWGVPYWSSSRPALTRTHLVSAGRDSLHRELLLSVPLEGGDVVWHYPNSGTITSVADVALDKGDAALFVYGEALLTRIIPGESTPFAQSRTRGIVRQPPSIGEDGDLYVSSVNGMLSVHRADLAWHWGLGGLEPELSAPLLDCGRASSGAPTPGSPGVVYLASHSGKLYALVTDSRGLRTDAPWPMSSHDPKASGNGAAPLSPFACP